MGAASAGIRYGMFKSIVDRFAERLAAFQDVESSNLEAVEYDEDNAILKVEFHSGSTYEFYDVPQDVYKELLEADSHGSYFWRHIRSRYDYRRI